MGSLPCWIVRGYQSLCNSCQAGDYYAQGHPVGKKNPWRKGLGFDREKHLARKFPERIPDLEKMKKKRCLSCGKEIEEESMKKHFEESCQYEGKCRYCFQMWVQETPEMRARWRVPMIMPLSQAHLIKCK